MKRYLFLAILLMHHVSHACCCSNKAIQKEPGRVVFTVGVTNQATAAATLQKPVATIKKNAPSASQAGSSALPTQASPTLDINGKKYAIRHTGPDWYGADGEDGKRYIITKAQCKNDKDEFNV